jgi:hypothetical protein
LVRETLALLSKGAELTLLQLNIGRRICTLHVNLPIQKGELKILRSDLGVDASCAGAADGRELEELVLSYLRIRNAGRVAASRPRPISVLNLLGARQVHH